MIPQYLKNRWLRLTNHFNISIKCIPDISVRDIKVQLYIGLVKSSRSSKTKHKTYLQTILIEWWCLVHGRNLVNSNKSKTPQHTTVHTFFCILYKYSQHGVKCCNNKVVNCSMYM